MSEPYPKSKQLAGHQKEKDTPKIFNKKRYSTRKKKPKTNKNVEVYENRRIPHWKQRGEFSRKTKNEILDMWGSSCFICGNQDIQFHHVYEKGFGKGGRGVKTNGLPLCDTHHKQIHLFRELYNRIRQMFINRFGEHYYKDKYDLWMEGLIENPTDELYEKFMRKEEEKCKKKLTTENG